MTSFWIVSPPASAVVAVAVVVGSGAGAVDTGRHAVVDGRIVVVAARADAEGGDGQQRRGRGARPHRAQPTFTRSTTKTSVSFGAIGPMPRGP